MLGRWASSRSSPSRRQEKRTERETWKWTDGQKKKRRLRELQALFWSLFSNLGGTSRMRGPARRVGCTSSVLSAGHASRLPGQLLPPS